MFANEAGRKHYMATGAAVVIALIIAALITSHSNRGNRW